MTNLPCQEIPNKLNKEDEQQNKNSRKNGHIMVETLITISQGNISQSTSSNRSGHSGLTNQRDQRNSRHPNQVRQTFPQVNTDNVPEGCSTSLRRLNDSSV